MTYYSGTLIAVPTASKEIYTDYARTSWPLFQRLGAVRMVETWGADIQAGDTTDFQRATLSTPDESIVFSWIEWPDEATADKAWAEMETLDPSELPGEMPFDGARMMFGGFAPVVSSGTDKGADYIQGFVLAVPASNKIAYIAEAERGWAEMFSPLGCLGLFENWGVDVPHGELTDFYRATKAEDGEVILFSWTAWADKATCDAAARQMEADYDPESHHAEMPFDGARMIWGGFDVIYDSDRHSLDRS
ncbi:DUF1428 domain-containing protein [Ketogulonicigenium vulgare]|uniref:DUF1428 domain-containing protein n=1 Tax=Ketogulonicigenium vulgare (strain WSH-001) TaxID=759362 RepID=F9YAL9_KETVW|nr:DUF1428 domain-containing protein [Ketogulonicigenium vulgare]ADO43256.1 conserved hypothetical protein [Ketogulonicigenium vulgare Y25]AEM41550.1 hypothetical protein KVU_1711 [Ketogulonicigenium vulgare WSH-001]ALJ81668.1 hypothetical protein KVH_11120 [Ketogulonicigenium vulgare]ANW34338.1 hypothetical protein KvSKV_11035 [Ketogulonicigenium vulgare]AOZ55292.1 hypothetical protein KVC_2287 [Ketogulonicigenium vulgare]